MNSNTMIIGVTGNTGAGKSTVARILMSKINFKTLNADKIARRVLHEKSIESRLVRTFGKNILSKGKISRKKLAKAAFSSFSSVKKLNAITHPAIRREINKQMRKNIILDAPLLIEGGFYKKCDYVILVKCDKNTILQRTKKRRYDVRERIKHQLPEKGKIKYADFVIDNNDSLSNTRKQVNEIARIIT